jgi:hypothetical protein
MKSNVLGNLVLWIVLLGSSIALQAKLALGLFHLFQ